MTEAYSRFSIFLRSTVPAVNTTVEQPPMIKRSDVMMTRKNHFFVNKRRLFERAEREPYRSLRDGREPCLSLRGGREKGSSLRRESSSSTTPCRRIRAVGSGSDLFLSLFFQQASLFFSGPRAQKRRHFPSSPPNVI